MTPIIVGSANADVGMEAGIEILRSGGCALDAVEAACRLVEDNLADHSVGTGGYPNLIGEVELDASIMDGTSRRAGAVAAVKEFPYPISIARAVMDKLPQHLLLVGDGAARFATEHGFEKRNLLTDDAATAWKSRQVIIGGESYALTGDLLTRSPSSDATAASRQYIPTLADQAMALHDPAKTSGTVNILAVDRHGHFASAVSTSGWAFKYPGRVGDSPIIGAGNYCDDRFGACGCTGLGEWAIRASTARSVVLAMQFGLGLQAACESAFDDLALIPVMPEIDAIMSLVALDREGRHAGYSTAPGKLYVWQTAEMRSWEMSARTQMTAAS